MHQAIVNLGYTILKFFTSIDGAALTLALKIVGIGMLGIFIVTGVIILVVLLLKKLFSK